MNPLTRQFLDQGAPSPRARRPARAHRPPGAGGLPPSLLACLPVARRSRPAGRRASTSTSSSSRAARPSSRDGRQPPKVDPETLPLSARPRRPGAAFPFVTPADKQGHFRVAAPARRRTSSPPARRPLRAVRVPREAALEGYLAAFLERARRAPGREAPGARRRGATRRRRAASPSSATGRGAAAQPARDARRAQGGRQPYRFAAARVAGRTFRGLLAGTAGARLGRALRARRLPGRPRAGRQAPHGADRRGRAPRPEPE